MHPPQLPAGLHVLERGWLSANNIVFTCGEKTAVIDSGYWTHAGQTVGLVEAVLSGRPLDLLVNTHLHSDHCGGNAALQLRYPAVQTLIPPGQARYVAEWDPVALSYLPTGQFCPRFRFDATLQPGSSIPLGACLWEVHAAAGHDPHSLVFFEPRERILISADALWENGFGVVFPELEGEEGFAEVAATLDLIERLDPAIVIPGHGRVFHHAPEILAKARSRLDAFAKNPVSHARHAVKALLKFKLLEVQRQPLGDFVLWAAATPYFLLIHERVFKETPLGEWLRSLCAQLIGSGVARVEDGCIVNA